MEKEAINELIAKASGMEGDFCSDLNAMHSAEKMLTPRQCEKYFGLLATAPYDRSKGLGAEAWQAHSTAAQRAEAFLKTIGKWEE